MTARRRPDGNGDWIWSAKGVRPVPYRLPALLERPEDALAEALRAEANNLKKQISGPRRDSRRR